MTKIKQQPALFAVFLASAALVVDLFLPWQEVDGEQISGFHGIGIPAMVFVFFVAVESTLQARGIVKKIPIPPALLILLPSLVAFVLVVIKFFVDSEGRTGAAYAGVALAVIMVVAAYANALAMLRMVVQMRKMMQAAKAGAVPASAPVASVNRAETIPGTTAAAPAGGASCDGDWAITMDTPMGVQQMTLTLLSQGRELTGRADTPFGEQQFYNGSVNGDDIAWEIEVTTPMPMTLEFKATINGDALKGTAEVAGMGESPFEGVRKG